jgi:ribosome biogenesis protein ERB1
MEVPFDKSSTSTEKKCGIEWQKADDKQWIQGYRFIVTHQKEVKQVIWHGKGDYFATMVPQADSKSVLIHQLSRRRSQQPFTKLKGLVQCVMFHPVQPCIFVANQQHIRVYNLIKQELVKKLRSTCKWISSMSIHPGGDNLIIGSYDCKLTWFDMDLSTSPYRSMKHHKQAVRQVVFHRRYPLFASGSDDATVIVFHGMVYNDLLQNATIVPVKVLRGHRQVNDLGVLDCQFHPTQPWIFSSGADGTVRLFT